jgi:hypothetical protein
MRRQVDIYRAVRGLKDLREATIELVQKGLEAAAAEKADKTIDR